MKTDRQHSHGFSHKSSSMSTLTSESFDSRDWFLGNTGVQSQVGSYQRLFKMILDTALLNTLHYKVRIKGEVEQSRERSSDLPYISM